MRPDRKPRADGERTREAILRKAVALATIDGLEGLSIGNLASALGMSKSGIYAHFGSKQDLQLATVDAAGEIFRSEVVDPALEAPDGLAVYAQRPNVVLLRTFSKAYGLAGLRVGYAVARPRLAAGIRAVSTPFGVSHVAQRAAIASLAARDELLQRVEHLVADRARLVEGLRDQGWVLPESQANFVWFDLGERTMQRAEEARAAGAIVRPFAGEGLRVSVGEPEATDLFLRVSATWL